MPAPYLLVRDQEKEAPMNAALPAQPQPARVLVLDGEVRVGVNEVSDPYLAIEDEDARGLGLCW